MWADIKGLEQSSVVQVTGGDEAYAIKVSSLSCSTNPT